MRLKSVGILAASQRIRRPYVANIFMLCLLSAEVWSYANIGAQQHRFARQLNGEAAVNYEDTAMTNSYHQPHFIGNRTVVVQLFEWRFIDIAEECRSFLGPQGYAGVQISPVLEHTVIKTAELNHPWWERYEVVSYRLATRSGDESEFWSMSRICNEHGVRIYADVVLNHMAAPLRYLGVTDTDTDNEDFLLNTLLETHVNISKLNYPNVSYTQQDFHRPWCMILADAQDAHEIRNCQLNGHPDLDHSKRNVQKNIVEMLNKFVDMGVAGFRIDTAKYMWPIDLRNILKQVKNLNTDFGFEQNSRPFVCLDVLDLGLDTISKTEYTTYGVVSEYLYPVELAKILNRQVPLSSLINWGPALGFLSHGDSLVFIDSHDTQRGLPLALSHNRLLTYKERLKYIMANVFLLVHPYGAVKRMMSSYYFPDEDINQGPPVAEADEEEIRSPTRYNEQQQCTRESGWVCEHRWPQLLNALKVANYFRVPGNEEESVIYFQTGGPHQVAFCRGHKAFVAMNNDPEMDFVKEVYACLEPGIYCDVVTGGKKEGREECHGKVLEINEQGYTKLELAVADDADNAYETEEEEKEESGGRIESYGILVIYVESKIEPKGNLPAVKSEVDAENTDTEGQKRANEADNDDKDVNDVGSKDEPGEENAAEENFSSAGNEMEDTATNTLSSEGDKDDKMAEENAKDNLPAEDEEVSEGEQAGNDLEGTLATETLQEHIENVSPVENEVGNGAATENEEEVSEAEDDVQNKEILNETPNKVDDEPEDSVQKEIDQPRNINGNTSEAEEQIEKPSAEIVDDIDAAPDVVTAKIQDIQKAGAVSKPQEDGNNG